MAQTYPQTEAEMQEHIERVSAAYGRAMKAEGKGPGDEMGLRARWIVWWDLEGSPGLQRTRAALWEHRMFWLGCVSAVIALAGVLLTALKFFWL